MSFSGKRYRRTACHNLEGLVGVNKSNESLLQYLQGDAPVFSYKQLDAITFRFCLQIGNKYMWYDFRLGEEFEMERRDGSKMKLLFTLENDNVLKQTIKNPNGKVIYFTKEFGEKETKMTITMEGTNQKATVFYEVVK